MRLERDPGYECNNMAAFQRTLPVLPGNPLVAEEDSCSLGLDGARDLGISSNRSSNVEFTNSEVEDDSESLGEDEKEAGNARSKSSGKKGSLAAWARLKKT